MKQKLLSQNAISKFLVLSCFLLFNASFGATFYSKANGNWNAPATWSLTDNGTALTGTALEGTNYPGPNDIVYIRANHTITINIPLARCSSLTFGSTVIAQNALSHAANIVLGNVTSGTFNLEISGNLTVLTSNSATASTTVFTRSLNIYKNDQAIISTVTVNGNIVVGNAQSGYIDAITSTSNIRRKNQINFGTVASGVVSKYGPDVVVGGNVNMFSHQVAGQPSLPNERYNLSAVRLNSGKMTLTGTDLMEVGSEETTGTGYIKSFRKSHTNPANYSEGQSVDNRFFMDYSDAGATLELNHHTDNPFYITGNIAISYPTIPQGIIIYKSTSGNSSVICPNVHRDLIIDNSAGATVEVVGSGVTAQNTVKVNNSLTLTSGTFNVAGDGILDIGNSGFILYMKGGELTTEADANFVLSNKISIYYSDNAAMPGIELTKAMGTGVGFTDNLIDELVLDPGSVAFDFSSFSDVEADVIRFRRPNYELLSGNFYAQALIELGGSGSDYNGCVFITPRLDITASSILSTEQTVRTTIGSTVAAYQSFGLVNLGNPAGAITVTLGANLTTTNVNMLGIVSLVRAAGVENSYFNVHGFFKLGDDTTYDLTSNGILTLKSLAFETARVSKQESYSGEIIGNVNVERFLQNDGGDGNGRFWRLLTAPVVKLNSVDEGTIWKHWQNNGEAFAIGDLGYGTDVWGSDASYTMEANGMYYLNPGTHNFRKYVSSAQSVGAWSPVSNTLTEELFSTTTNNAFLAFIIKPFGQGVTVGDPNTSSPGSISTVLSATGKLRFGNISTTILKNRYHLIGNPYASPISVGPLLSSNPNKTTGKIWVLDSKLGSFGGYVTYDATTGLWSDPIALHNGSTVIQSGEGFFVKTANLGTASTTFNIVESLKNETISSASVFGRSAQATSETNDSFELMRVLLKKVTNGVASHEDGSTVVFYAGGVNEVDESDAEKFSNPNGTISLINGTTKMAIEHRATVVAGDEVFVNVSNVSAGTDYKLNIYTENFTFSGTATLHDLKLGTTTVMPIDGSVFEYPFTVTSDATTQGTRFKIVFGNGALSIDDNANENNVNVYPNPVSKSSTLTLNLGTLENKTYSYKIVNLLGQTIQTGKLEKTELNQEFALTFNTAFSAGLYAIEVLDQNKVVNASKIIIK
ncbi:T9SS type A sorting domain-containing protein [uncultured Flavobacterium sp.]|uniref:T9SS type A sorting domain-containing protein n=1 Tax=uncultured Flavobacterium sp. TaxID=165435 RepID=UPI002599B55E|nr:T9SS type A sorting domain-containing protein [uncultured Flavobacterium sp.]